MNQTVTTAIILSRTNFGEADRILTLLTPDHGKIRLMAKCVRKISSKLAGGVELFSGSTITFIRGRGEIGTLVSARLVRHFGYIVTDLKRVQLGYALIKLLNKNIEDESGEEYYRLLEQVLGLLNDPEMSLDIIQDWYCCQMLRLDGHTPNLQSDVHGRRLAADETYSFSIDDMAFMPNKAGIYGSSHIKYLRLLCGNGGSAVLQKVRVSSDVVQAVAALLQSMFSSYLLL